jgi:hypothetical protein
MKKLTEVVGERDEGGLNALGAELFLGAITSKGVMEN